MTPCWGNPILPPFFPATPSSPYRTLKGLFKLTRHPPRALNLDAFIASELQRYKDIVRCAALDAKVPGRRPQQLTQTFIVCLWNFFLRTFLHRSLIVKSQQSRIELVTRSNCG